jgi:hypothetical protein
MKTSVSIAFALVTSIVSMRSEAFPVYESQVYSTPLVEQPGNGGGFQALQAFCGSGDIVVGGSCWTDDSTASLTQSGAPSSSSWVCSWNNNGSTRGYRKVFARCAHAGPGTTQWDTSRWGWTYDLGPGNGTGYDVVDGYCDGGFPISGGCWTIYSTAPSLTQSGMFSGGWVCSWNDNGVSQNQNYSYVQCQTP